MKRTTLINGIDASISWNDEKGFYRPKIDLDSIPIEFNEILIVQPDDSKNWLAEYLENYGVELNPSQFYYYDGECFHEEMRGTKYGFSAWLAEEVNGKLAELNGA
ncbi:hypothetical protein [Endozoicomonas acroporae]|uniref:hypothetical protein n=1 Tax=Endozoicomonas acroporae TaxID=1701104 RepID=UPI0013D0C956|nr:hypothetical protein [Endozoicomonas acroporae]